MTASGPVVVGLDLSLTQTGIARWTAEHLWLTTIATKPQEDAVLRLREIRRRVVAHVRDVDLVVVEALPPGNRIAKSASINERAGLYYMVLDRLHELVIPYAEVQPSLLKGYALGKGVGTKTEVTAAVVRRYGADPSNDDETDACVLAAMGLHHLGHPPRTVPMTHQRWMVTVRWPTAKEAS